MLNWSDEMGVISSNEGERLNFGEGMQREASEVMVASLQFIYWVALFY
jgi:hypothetical protein